MKLQVKFKQNIITFETFWLKTGGVGAIPVCGNYRNFRSFTRTADYPHWPIIAYGEKKSQQITRTGG